MEDAEGEESGGVEDAVDDVGGGEGGPDDVRSVPVIPGIGRLTDTGAEGVPAAVAVPGRARRAPREGGEEGLLLRGGLCDGGEVHVVCRDGLWKSL